MNLRVPPILANVCIFHIKGNGKGI